MIKYRVDIRYQDTNWIVTDNVDMSEHAAFRRARIMSKKPMEYGMVRIVKSEGEAHSEVRVWCAGEGRDRKAVLVDLDKTLLRYNKEAGLDAFGRPYSGAREFLAGLRDLEREVIIWTCRSNARQGTNQRMAIAQIMDYMDLEGLYYDMIWPGKPQIEAIIDDKAVQCGPGYFNHPAAQRQHYARLLHIVKGLV